MKAGQRLTLKRPQHGCAVIRRSRVVLMFPVMGSCSTDPKAGIGGLQARLLKDGDRLPIGKAKRVFRTAGSYNAAARGNRPPASPGRKIMSSIVPRRMHSGVRPGSQPAKRPYGLSLTGPI
ncbi:hypothetical protein ACNKHS_03505 [Shigella flexneri]